ncbi:MAG: nucleotidyltransferase [Actinobacteria bacterium]|nr:nucleotidyltransferase [Actinomycetota bacterium]
MAEEQSFSNLVETMRKTAAALREADLPFLLGGGMAAWARGGPESNHDVDFLMKHDDAERALEDLRSAGFEPERPPENWLFKVWDGEVFVDLIFDTAAGPVTDELFERSDELEVHAVRMKVAALEDVVVAKLCALDEQDLDYRSCLEVARSLREQIDWKAVRARTEGSPYARAFFTLLRELEIVDVDA